MSIKLYHGYRLPKWDHHELYTYDFIDKLHLFMPDSDKLIAAQPDLNSRVNNISTELLNRDFQSDPMLLDGASPKTANSWRKYEQWLKTPAGVSSS